MSKTGVVKSQFGLLASITSLSYLELVLEIKDNLYRESKELLSPPSSQWVKQIQNEYLILLSQNY